jgi:D-beta-D-heptose 7-phosphate kinase/D-beta-D-heptose 1-phosphate adenosyltransferase
VTDVRIQIEPHRVDDVLACARSRPVLVVGDVMIDRYLWGNVTRISPEAPVPVVEVERETSRLGGAANVARNLHGLGAAPELIGVVGQDEAGARLAEVLERTGIANAGLVQDPGRRTTEKTRIVARNQQVVRVDQEDRAEVADRVAEALLERVLAGLSRARAVILSDYGKGVITRALLERILPEARDRGIPVSVDPKDTHFFSYVGVSVITPNQHEAAEVLGYKLRTEDAVSRAGAELLARLHAECVLITRGEKGMSLFERDGRRTDFPVTAQAVYDVTGAGDTVVSAYTVARVGGAAPWEAALFAGHAAGLVVAEVGTAVPDLEALRRSFRGGER